jgi:hypothetical protein
MSMVQNLIAHGPLQGDAMNRVAKLLHVVAFVSVTSLLFMTGCAAKVTQNWTKVKTGMNEKEVTDLLGAPKERIEIDPGALMKGLPMPVPGMEIAKTAVLSWEDGDKAYVVHLQGDKVIFNGSGTKEEMNKKRGK